MQATVTTVSTKQSISRILVLGAGALMAFVLGAALALAATGWFAQGDRTAPVFNATGALHSHVLRENAATAVAQASALDPTVALQTHVLREYGATAAPALAMQAALHEQVLRENRAR